MGYPAFPGSTPVDETACPLMPLGRPKKRIIQISFRIYYMSLHIVTAPDDGSTDTQRAPPSRRGHADKALIHGHTSHATTRPRRPLHTPFRRGIGHRAGRDPSPPLHPWLCRATSAAASSSQLQPRGERLVCPESKRAAGWVENRSEVVRSRVRIKGVIGTGVSGSKGEGPGTVNVLRVAAAVSRKNSNITCA